MNSHAPTPGNDQPIRPRCGAKTRAGGTCGRIPMRGQKRCDMHGGKVPAVRAAAKRRLARAELEDLISTQAPPIEVEPHTAILAMIHAAAGRVAFWQRIVDDLDAGELTWGTTKVKTGGHDTGRTEEARPHIAYTSLREESDRLVKYADVALRAGVEAERVRIAREDGQQIARVLVGFLERVGLDRDEAARAALAETLTEVLAIEGRTA